MAYIVTRNKKSGYVALVEKKRVPVAGNKTSVRNVGYVCGLGVMDQNEFEEFRDWAHGITHQESRKEAVLACPRVVKKTKETTEKIAGEQQKATTVKRAKRVKKVPTEEEMLSKAKAREIELAEQRTRVEARKGIKRTERTKKATPKTGIVFTGRKSLAEKRKVLSDRIAQLKLHITNTKTDLAIAARRSGSWRTPDSRVPAWKEKMANYQGAVKTLKKQRAELRR